MDTESIIELDNIVKRYGDREILRLGELSIQRGTFLAIEGPSGCGKSTLVNIIGLLDRPTMGAVRLGGQEYGQASETERAAVRNRTIGFVFQHFNLLPDLSALQNVALPLIPRRMRRSARTQAAAEALAAVGLGEKADRRPSQLSGGEQQRVAIARAMVTRPKILLADEPTGNLDRDTADGVLETIRSLQQERGTTVVLVTHDPEVSRRADRVLRHTLRK